MPSLTCCETAYKGWHQPSFFIACPAALCQSSAHSCCQAALLLEGIWQSAPPDGSDWAQTAADFQHFLFGALNGRFVIDVIQHIRDPASQLTHVCFVEATTGNSLKPIPGRSARAITHLIPEVRP